jgi:hypothetical protein
MWVYQPARNPGRHKKRSARLARDESSRNRSYFAVPLSARRGISGGREIGFSKHGYREWTEMLLVV